MRPARAVTLALITVLLPSTSACQLSTGAVDTSDIVIAADLELSGASASVGTAYRRALELKIDQVNLRGVLGSRKLKLEVRDNRSDRTLAMTNVSDYANRTDVAAIITGSCSACLVASAKLIDEKRVPTISLAPAQEVSTPVAERHYVFKVGPNAGDGAAALAAELERANIRSAGIITTTDEYGVNGETALRRELGKASVAVTASTAVKPTDTDMVQPVQRVLEGRPQALVLWTPPAQASSAAIAARDDGFDGRLFFDIGAAGELFFSGEAATATNNATMISTQTMAIDDVVATTPAKAARKQWFRDYTSRYGTFNGYSSFAADAVQLIVNAIETVGGTNRERMREALETAQMDGISGPIRITPDNHSGLMPQALVALVARNGRWRIAS